jgi:hypothetical protein
MKRIMFIFILILMISINCFSDAVSGAVEYYI